MSRLPSGGEEEWGKVLNEFLLVAQSANGTPGVFTRSALAGGSIL